MRNITCNCQFNLYHVSALKWLHASLTGTLSNNYVDVPNVIDENRKSIVSLFGCSDFITSMHFMARKRKRVINGKIRLPVALGCPGPQHSRAIAIAFLSAGVGAWNRIAGGLTLRCHCLDPLTPSLNYEDMYCSFNFWVCGRNPMVWPFKWNISSSTFSCYHFFFNILQYLGFFLNFDFGQSWELKG